MIVQRVPRRHLGRRRLYGWKVGFYDYDGRCLYPDENDPLIPRRAASEEDLAMWQAIHLLALQNMALITKRPGLEKRDAAGVSQSSMVPVGVSHLYGERHRSTTTFEASSRCVDSDRKSARGRDTTVGGIAERNGDPVRRGRVYDEHDADQHKFVDRRFCSFFVRR